MSAAAIFLAAGAARRMGRLKQLLPYGEGTLLQHAIRQAQAAGFERIIVVVGAESERVTESLTGFPIEIAFNPAWESGMGSSIQTGMRLIADETAVAILLGDQPRIMGTHLISLRQLFENTGAAIVAAHYNGMLGVPAIFRREVFPALLAVPPESGARHLLRGQSVPVIPFPLPEAAVDVDTPADFAAISDQT